MVMFGSESNGSPDSIDKPEMKTDIKPTSKREAEGDSSILTIRLEEQKTKTESVSRNIASADIKLQPVIEETKKEEDTEKGTKSKEDKKNASKELLLDIEDQIQPQATMKDMFGKQGRTGYKL